LLVTFILFGLGMVSVPLKQILFNSRFNKWSRS
jgi:hypothetical protein